LYTDKWCSQVFIIISGLGAIWAWFFLPETKGVPLEEIAALFGDRDEVMIFSEDIHVDHTTHELVVDTHGARADGGITHRVATEASASEKAEETVVGKA
jgi:hypothetical protein